MGKNAVLEFCWSMGPCWPTEVLASEVSENAISVLSY